MPKPTVVIPFGKDTSTSTVFCVVELDEDSNLDSSGNSVDRFLDTELVHILVHLQPGSVIKNVKTSFGTIVNKMSRVLVSVTRTVEEVKFKSNEATYTLPHIPNSVSVEWIGNTGTLKREGREISVVGAPLVCSLTYSFFAYQFILKVPSLGLIEDDTFPVEISFEVE